MAKHLSINYNTQQDAYKKDENIFKMVYLYAWVNVTLCHAI
jgi:hypothetical protein